MDTKDVILTVATGLLGHSAPPPDLAPTVNVSDEINFGFQLGLGFGGDDVFSGNSNNKTISAGDVTSFGGYVLSPLLANELFFKTSANLMSKGKNYHDGESERLGSMSIDALIMKQVDDLNFGAGITYHLNPSYEFDYNDGNLDKVNYDSAAGFILEFNKALKRGFNAGVRYTHIEYTGERSSDSYSANTATEVDASSIALTMSYTLQSKKDKDTHQ